MDAFRVSTSTQGGGRQRVGVQISKLGSETKITGTDRTDYRNQGRGNLNQQSTQRRLWDNVSTTLKKCRIGSVPTSSVNRKPVQK